MLKIHRLIITKTPIAILLKKSKFVRLPGFEGVPLYDVIKFFYRQIKTVGITERASAISYNFIMAIPPSFLFLFTLIPQLPLLKRASIKRELHSIITDIVPAKVHNDYLIKFVDSFIDNSRIGLLSFSLLLSLYFASNAIMGLMRSFNKNYIGFSKRAGLHNRLVALRLTIIIFLLVLSTIILLIAQDAVLKWAGIKSVTVREVLFFIRWGLIVALIFYSIAFIYMYAPAVQKRWRLYSPGTIVATFLSIMVTLGFSFFVNQYGRYNALYGSIGTIMVLMALIYINSVALLTGFELNVSIKSLKAIAEQRKADEEKLAAEKAAAKNEA